MLGHDASRWIALVAPALGRRDAARPGDRLVSHLRCRGDRADRQRRSPASLADLPLGRGPGARGDSLRASLVVWLTGDGGWDETDKGASAEISLARRAGDRLQLPSLLPSRTSLMPPRST
jgi:hypothetical protein